jgi:carbamoylphosphate synthase large subunit
MAAKQELDRLTTAIRAGALTPSQMEDVVYAMHAAYVDHFQEIGDQLSTDLESVADFMVVARKSTESFGWEDEEPRRCGYVHTVPNIEGVSLERAL